LMWGPDAPSGSSFRSVETYVQNSRIFSDSAQFNLEDAAVYPANAGMRPRTH